MKKQKIQPVAGYILVKPQKQEKTTASGIILPDSATQKPRQGEVLAVGASVVKYGHEIKSPCKTGDIVIYRKLGEKQDYKNYKLDDVNYLILKFDDIMAIIN